MCETHVITTTPQDIATVVLKYADIGTVQYMVHMSTFYIAKYTVHWLLLFVVDSFHCFYNLIGYHKTFAVKHFHRHLISSEQTAEMYLGT